ncbi:hypothetical protein Tco_1581375 [Tanacetum coccineum]
MPQEDEVFLAEEQPLPAAASPTAQSPDYVLESDHEADPKEDDDEDPEEDPDDEEEEHPAPADSVVVALPAADQALSAKETEPFETDESAATPPPHLANRVTARISIPAPVPTPVWSDVEVARLLAISTPPSSPLSPWSSPLPQIPSSPLPPIPSPSLLRGQIEVTLPPRKRLGIALGPAYEVRKSSSAAAARPAGGLRADYGFVATIDREIRRDPERDVGYRSTDSHDTDEIYTRLDDEQSGRQLLAGRINMLFRDRRAHAHTARLMETEARMSKEAWGRSMDASDLARAKVMLLRTIVLAQQSQIREL